MVFFVSRFHMELYGRAPWFPALWEGIIKHLTPPPKPFQSGTLDGPMGTVRGWLEQLGGGGLLDPPGALPTLKQSPWLQTDILTKRNARGDCFSRMQCRPKIQIGHRKRTSSLKSMLRQLLNQPWCGARLAGLGLKNLGWTWPPVPRVDGDPLHLSWAGLAKIGYAPKNDMQNKALLNPHLNPPKNEKLKNTKKAPKFSKCFAPINFQLKGCEVWGTVF